MLPSDMKPTFSLDASPDQDSMVEKVIRDMQLSAPRRFAETVMDNVDAIVGMGQARRLRLVCWMLNRAWPDTQFVRDLRKEEVSSDSSGSSAKASVARLFRKDYESILKFCARQTVRGARTKKTVGALYAGVVEFAQSPDFPPSGGF